MLKLNILIHNLLFTLLPINRLASLWSCCYWVWQIFFWAFRQWLGCWLRLFCSALANIFLNTGLRSQIFGALFGPFSLYFGHPYLVAGFITQKSFINHGYGLVSPWRGGDYRNWFICFSRKNYFFTMVGHYLSLNCIRPIGRY